MLVILFFGVWLSDGTLRFSVTETLNLMNQKLRYTLNSVENELESASLVQSIEASKGEFELGLEPIFDNAAVGVIPQEYAQKGSEVLAANVATDGSEKWIEVDLSDQRIYAKEGERTVYNFLVSTGKKWTPTPKGEYRVWIKLRYTRMKGGSRARGDYYDLPNVPYTMYFYKGYGIHGAYWHNQFGTPRSHGCVNVKPEEMALIYNWAGPEMPAGHGAVKATPDNPGIRIVIHD
jgi:lipoprotein-anchoring transpeptidase ErfK/SrfK